MSGALKNGLSFLIFAKIKFKFKGGKISGIWRKELQLL